MPLKTREAREVLSKLKERRASGICPLCGAELNSNYFCHNGDGLVDDEILEDIVEYGED